jgi:hypothetical protein
MFVRQRDTLDSLELYCEQAHSSILYLMLEAVNITDDDSLQLVSHLGVATGIALYLRSLPADMRVGNLLFIFAECTLMEMFADRKRSPVRFMR